MSHRFQYHPFSACNVKNIEKHETLYKISKLEFPCSPFESEKECLKNRCIAIHNFYLFLNKDTINKQKWERFEKANRSYFSEF